MNRTEADKLAMEKNGKFFPFCPVIKAMCKHECVCFVGASVTAGRNNKECFYVGNPYCSHVLVAGGIWINS